MDWDDIDWDEKVGTIIKNQQRVQDTSETVKFLGSEDDGNYYEANQEKKIHQQKQRQDNAGSSRRPTRKIEESFQSYSHKDLQRIRESSKSSLTINQLVHETFGQLERFLLTHEMDLTDDALVDLLIIDVSLLEIPFHKHNEVLLRNISKIESFWAQLLKFIEKFLSIKYQDVKFLLTVDMNGFFSNIEILLHNLIVSNLFNVEMENVFKEIVEVMERFANNKWSCAERLKNIHESYKTNRDVFKIYDVSFVNLLNSFRMKNGIFTDFSFA